MIEEEIIMKNNYILMQYYMKYLKDVRGLSDSSIGHYTQALNTVSKMLKEHSIIEDSIYELKDIGELSRAREYIYSNPDFVALDTRGNRMYSAGLNNYYRFASGEEMFGKTDVLKSLDTELPVGEKVVVSHEEWKRSSIIKIQSLEAAGYQCEVNPRHVTFIAKATGNQYMEGHHAIPMQYQEKFIHSIDVYANVVCLCPVCHRLLHYGEDEPKKMVVSQIYESRKDRLATSGIRISRDDFIQLVI